MSEQVIIALISAIPSAMVAIVSIVSSNVALRYRMKQVERQMDDVSHTVGNRDYYRIVTYEQTMLQSQLSALIRRVDWLEQINGVESPKENDND